MMVSSLHTTSIRILQGALVINLLFNILFLCVSHFAVSSTTRPDSHPSSTTISRQILFVGGVPRSGTTLARSMLDAHPDVHCGEETHVIPRVLDLNKIMTGSPKELSRLKEGGVSKDLLNDAAAAFISDIILGHGTPGRFLCNKDPLVLGHMNAVTKMFPKSKFVLMIRDGRAVAYSIVSRKVSIGGVDTSSFLSAAKFWNRIIAPMVGDCLTLGEDRCLPVYYEHLVTDPKTWMEKILAFGGIPWHENVLHHHELINKEVFLSK